MSVDVPSSMKLQMAPVGKVMAISANIPVHSPSNSQNYSACPNSNLPFVRTTYDIAPGSLAELESGYSDVYKTGVTGIGVRLKSISTFAMKNFSIPGSYTYENFALVASDVIKTFRFEFVRTAQGVGYGDLKLNFKIRVMVDQWYAANININGITRAETDSYFSGCAGVKKNINVPMGKIWVGDMTVGATRTESFDLNVHCTGLPAGTKLPVNVYFEGDSPGDGRLNLNGGGAGGVEISLFNDQGQALPFSKSRAMAMHWIRSEVQGELYNLPVRARYIRKGSAQITPGRADATLNYILEYN